MTSLLVLVIALCFVWLVQADTIPFSVRGLANVRDNGAKGDGVTDDTTALQTAITNGGMVYVPNGVYRVSKQLVWKNSQGAYWCGSQIIGQSRDKTIFSLIDNAVGFNDPLNPQAVFYLASCSFSTSPFSDGGGNEAFGNNLRDFTVLTGNNPGASGIDWIGNNAVSMRNINITGGTGGTGLLLTRSWPGPAYFQNIFISGFNYGIAISKTEYSVYFEHVTLVNQALNAITNDQNGVVFRDLTVISSVNSSAVLNVGNIGLLTIVDGVFKGAARSVTAISSTGYLYVRNTTCSGYTSCINEKGKTVLSPATSYATAKYSLTNASVSGLALSVKDAPVFVETDNTSYANVEDYGANGSDDWNDDTDGVQNAIDSGKRTIYFPSGRYIFSRPIYVRGNVRRLIGFGATISNGFYQGINAAAPEVMFNFVNLTGPSVSYEGLWVTNLYSNSDPHVGLIIMYHDSSASLVLKEVSLNGDVYAGYMSSPRAGSLFIDDVSATRYQFLKAGQHIYARNLNAEMGARSDNDPRVLNKGAVLWVLGLKTEGNGNVITTTNAGYTEVLGGLLYPVGSVSPASVAFINSNSSVSISIIESAYGSDNFYINLVEEIDAKGTRYLSRNALPGRTGAGTVIALYSGRLKH